MPLAFRTANGLALGLIVTPLASAALAAQVSAPPAVVPTLEACYVPISGTIYRLDTPVSPAPGAPKNCLSPAHAKFLWNQQGLAGPQGLKGDKGDPGSAANIGPDLTLPGILSVRTASLLDGNVTVGLPQGGNPFAQLLQLRDGPNGTGTQVFSVSAAGNVSASSLSLAGNGTATGAFQALGGLTSGGGLLAAGGVAQSVPSGAGTRLLFAPQKGAFRAGAVSGSAWDEVNLGPNSTALGLDVTASGAASTALGARASTNGQAGAFVYGDASTATTLHATTPNEFAVRASGGIRLRTAPDLSTGCDISPAGQLACTAGVAVGPDLALAGSLTATGATTLQGGLLAGNAGPAFTPPSGPGTRMFWYPAQAAFRTGAVSGAQWDPANIGTYSFAAGVDPIASGVAAVSLGTGTIASGENATALGIFAQASGVNSMALGTGVIASGLSSTALGRLASTNGRTGTFVYGDASTTTLFQAAGDNQFLVRAAGGTGFFSNAALTAGVSLPAGGGAWVTLSDVRKKTAFRPLDGETVLAKLRVMPVQSWQYRSQDASIRHIGPTAQDFRAAFGVGESDTTITTVDADGVALAGVKALEARTSRLVAENAALRARLARTERAAMVVESLRREMAALRAQVQALAAVRNASAPAPAQPRTALTPASAGGARPR